MNVEYRQNRIYGIVGNNGAGKSTFFRCICGLEKYKGKILYNDGVAKHSISYLATTPYVYPKLTGFEYLTFFLKLNRNENEQRSKIEGLNEIFKLPLNNYIETYSIGMVKKIAFFGSF